jgi:anaerobic selenocysteine-containing dehydrogenase
MAQAAETPTMGTRSPVPASRTVPTICRLCSAHCGVLATVTDGKLTDVRGDPDNPMYRATHAPRAALCPRFTTIRPACCIARSGMRTAPTRR